MNFMELAKRRYSVRKFTDKPVEPELLTQVLEVGLVAPTAKNLQPQRVYVLQSGEALKKLDGLTHCRYGAGTVLLFTYNAEEDWKNPLEKGVHSGVEDVSIAATHIMLRAAELGLGTCWCNYFANTKLKEAFDLPANERPVLIMPLGYADESAKPAPGHEQTKELSETVKYL